MKTKVKTKRIALKKRVAAKPKLRRLPQWRQLRLDESPRLGDRFTYFNPAETLSRLRAGSGPGMVGSDVPPPSAGAFIQIDRPLRESKRLYESWWRTVGSTQKFEGVVFSRRR